MNRTWNREFSKKTWQWPCLVLVMSFVMASSALAHHGWSGYDEGKTLSLTGVVKEASYTNPHGLIRLQVGGENGKVWNCVLAPPARMTARKLAQAELKVGSTATLVGYPHRQNGDEMRAEHITINGKTVELR